MGRTCLAWLFRPHQHLKAWLARPHLGRTLRSDNARSSKLLLYQAKQSMHRTVQHAMTYGPAVVPVQCRAEQSKTGQPPTRCSGTHGRLVRHSFTAANSHGTQYGIQVISSPASSLLKAGQAFSYKYAHTRLWVSRRPGFRHRHRHRHRPSASLPQRHKRMIR